MGTLLGESPDPYDWRLDPRARPNADERRKLSIHVDQCAIRQVEIKQKLSDIRIDRYNDRKLLVWIVVLLILVNLNGARDLFAMLLP